MMVISEWSDTGTTIPMAACGPFRRRPPGSCARATQNGPGPGWWLARVINFATNLLADIALTLLLLASMLTFA